MFVVDASVVVKWFVEEGDHLDAIQLTKAEAALKAPDIVLAEVAHVLRRKIRTGIISTAQASEAVSRLKTAFKHLVPSIDLIDVAFDLSSTMDHSIYDAMYLACALDDADDILVTADRKFAAKASAAGFDNKIRILGAALPGSTSPQENNHG